jgi:antitoxin VapB
MRPQVAKVYKSGHGQAVRLPAGFHFRGNEVLVYKEGDKVILCPKPSSWDDFFDSPLEATTDFMLERKEPPLQERDLF